MKFKLQFCYLRYTVIPSLSPHKSPKAEKWSVSRLRRLTSRKSLLFPSSARNKSWCNYAYGRLPLCCYLKWRNTKMIRKKIQNLDIAERDSTLQFCYLKQAWNYHFIPSESFPCGAYCSEFFSCFSFFSP